MLVLKTLKSMSGWSSAQIFARPDIKGVLSIFRSRPSAPRSSYMDGPPASPLRSVVLGGAGNSPVRQRRRKPMINGTKPPPGLVPRLP